MIDKRYIIAQEIANTDYSYFENPLREILEYRKAAFEKAELYDYCVKIRNKICQK